MENFKKVLWTLGLVGFGIFLGAFEIGGKTTVEHAVETWNAEAPKAAKHIRNGLNQTVRLAEEEESPKEHYGADDRAAVNKLVSRGVKSSKK